MQKIGKNKSTRTMTIIVLSLVVLIIFAVSYGYRGSKGDYRNFGPIAEKMACENKCKQEKLNGQLVPALTIRPANPYAYNGPWKCECERKLESEDK
jgi:hypothetical protein